MKHIPLTQNKFALVDNEDYEKVCGFKWYFSCDKSRRSAGYAKTLLKFPNGKKEWLWMHKFILGIGRDKRGDHRDGNGLNNQRYNIRPATLEQNCFNRRIQHDKNHSGFKGVSWFPALNKWRSRIKYKYKDRHLGYFEHIEDAAIAYDNAAKKFFGDFAKTNCDLGLYV